MLNKMALHAEIRFFHKGRHWSIFQSASIEVGFPGKPANSSTTSTEYLTASEYLLIPYHSSTIHYNTMQYNTIQYKQYNTIQYNTMQ